MPRSMRQNVILSHGGKHGPSSRTIRKGAPVTQQDMEQIPDHVLGEVTQMGVDAPDAPDKDVEARKRLRDEKLAQKGNGAEKKADKAKAPKPATEEPKPEPKPKAEEPKKEEAPPPPPPAPKAEEKPTELEVPTSKRELFLMKKADAIALLDQLGVDHADDISGKAAKELLADQLGLA